MKTINIGDSVYTFHKGGRYPIQYRKVVSILQTEGGKTIKVRPDYDPEYHSKEEKITFDEEVCFLDKNAFIIYLTNARDIEMYEANEKINKVYSEYFKDYKLQ